MLKRKEEAMKASQQTPGITYAKKPKLMDLTVDGTIDLQRYNIPCAQTQPQQPNNRERALAQKIPLGTIRYEAGKQLDNLRKYTGQHVEVELTREALLSACKVVKKRSIWGSSIYTADSDLFTVLIHQGFVPHTVADSLFAWPPCARELRALLKVLPAQGHYYSTSRNTMKSRAWAAASYNCSFSVERLWVVTAQGVDVELHAMRDGDEHEPAAPSFLLSHWDQRMSTRQVTHGSDRRKRAQSDVATIMYNLVNEPWLKYSSVLMADRAFTSEAWTCSRFHTSVLYLETDRERFEMYLNRGDSAAAANRPTYTFRRCLKVLPQTVMTVRGIPLPAAITTPLHTTLAWSSIQWATSVLELRHTADASGSTRSSYPIVRIHWMPITPPTPTPTPARSTPKAEPKTDADAAVRPDAAS